MWQNLKKWVNWEKKTKTEIWKTINANTSVIATNYTEKAVKFLISKKCTSFHTEKKIGKKWNGKYGKYEYIQNA